MMANEDGAWSMPATLPSIMHVLSFDFHNTLYQVVVFTVFNLSWVRVRLVIVVQSLNCVWLLATQWTAAYPQASLSFTIFPNLLKLMSIESVMPSDHLRFPPSPSAFNLSQHQGLSQWVSPLHQVAKVLEVQLQYQSFQWLFRLDFLQDWLVWSPCCPRDSQESSPASQFESINSLALSRLYGPTLTSIRDYWKNHRFDYMDLCRQSGVSPF